MTAIETLLLTARAYAAAEGIELVTASWRVFEDSKKIAALMETPAPPKRAVDVHTRRYEQAMQWFSANWPAGAAWPEGVRRPFVEGAVA